MIVTCKSCGQRWKANVPDSLYVQLDMASQPCPSCEAYTLDCQESQSTKSAPRLWQPRQGPASPAPRYAG